MEMIDQMAKSIINTIKEAEKEADIIINNGKNNKEKMISEAELKCKEIENQAIRIAKIESNNIQRKADDEILRFKDKLDEEYKKICDDMILKAKKKENEAIELITDIISM